MPDEIMQVEVGRIIPHPDNPRRGDVPAIMRSLERHGQVKPLIVQRSTGYVVAGNHTLEAAKRLGWATVKILVQDMDDEMARSYLLADNRTSDAGQYDKASLYETLLRGSLEGTGYSETDVEDLAQEVDDAGSFAEDEGDEIVRKSAEKYDPLRQIPLAVPVSEVDAFARQIADLQEHWGTRTTVETIRRLVDAAHAALPEPEQGLTAPAASTSY